MKIVNIKDIKYKKYLEEYCIICKTTWGKKTNQESMNYYVKKKISNILSTDKVILILALINNDELIGFVSLFKYEYQKDDNITPWYATLYVKEKYRGNSYYKILSSALLNKAKELGYKKVYLKTNLNNFYEKIGFIYINDLKNKEKLYYINL